MLRDATRILVIIVFVSHPHVPAFLHQKEAEIGNWHHVYLSNDLVSLHNVFPVRLLVYMLDQQVSPIRISRFS